MRKWTQWFSDDTTARNNETGSNSVLFFGHTALPLVGLPPCFGKDTGHLISTGITVTTILVSTPSLPTSSLSPPPTKQKPHIDTYGHRQVLWTLSLNILRKSYFCLTLVLFCFLITGSNFDFVKGFLSGVFLQMFSMVTYWLLFGAMEHFNGIIGLATILILF